MIAQLEFPALCSLTDAANPKTPEKRTLVIEPMLLGRLLQRVNLPYSLFLIMYVIDRSSNGTERIKVISETTGMSRHAINNQARRTYLLLKPDPGQSVVSLSDEGRELMDHIKQQISKLTPRRA